MRKLTDLKLNLNDVKYIHKGDVTIAKLNVNIDGYTSKDETPEWIEPFAGYFEYIKKNGLTKFTVTAIARLREGDEYDKVTGERIALGKAKIKALKRINKLLEYSNDYINTLALELFNSRMKTFTYYDTEKKHLEELMKRNLEK